MLAFYHKQTGRTAGLQACADGSRPPARPASAGRWQPRPFQQEAQKRERKKRETLLREIQRLKSGPGI